MKDKKIAFIKAVSNININSIMKDSDRGNLYRGKVSDEKLDSYIKIIKDRLDQAHDLLK